MILFWVVVIIGIVLLVRSMTPGQGAGGTGARGPLDVLKERYARGEIDTEEYEERCKKLQES
jgi:putative membrane protein